MPHNPLLPHRGEQNLDEARISALRALAWTLDDPARARRLLDMTGLDPASLRAAADERAVLAATLAFLEAHEPDLLACADAIGLDPAALVAARADLER